MTHVHALAWVASALLGAASGDVEIIISDPDGRPVANRMVRLVEVAPFPAPGPETPRPRDVTTDAEGRARIPLEIGLRRLRIRAAGVGFGGTGLFEVTPGHVTRPDVPRLARFARLEGKVDPALFKPGLKVSVSHSAFDQPSPDDLVVPCDAEGRFVFDEVVPGELHLRVLDGPRRVPAEPNTLSIEPGQAQRDVVLGPPPPPDPAAARQQQQTLDRLNWIKSKEEITWVEGTVRDTRGTPLKNAEVIVKGVYHGGIRNYSDLRTTNTDAKGHYQIRGPHSNFQDSFTVVVRVPGHAPVLAYARAPGWDDKGPRGPLDLTVPDQGGALTVRVLKDGKPAAKVPVALHERGFVERLWSRPTGNQQTLHQLFNPVQRTNNEGVARFTDLYPCRYELRASADGSGLSDFLVPGKDVARAVVPSVAIAAGEELSMAVSLQNEPDYVKVQALRPDGTPPAHESITFSFGLRETNTITSMDFNANGIGKYRFGDRGLWAVRLRFRETESPGMPMNWEPFYEGSTLLPISPAFKLEAPVKLTCDRHLPGSIQARLLDLAGKPARGAILLMSSFGPDDGAIDRAASTDEEGVARFTDVTSGSYRIRGSMERYRPPYRAMGSGPLPDDARLRDQVAFPAEEVNVESGTEARVQLQPVKVGYLRGKIELPPGADASEYTPFPVHDWLRFQGFTRRDLARGEYLCGPLLPGKAEVRLQRERGNDQHEEIPHFVTVAPGEVARLDLKAKADPAPSQRPEPSVSLGMRGISTMELPPEALAGTVVHSDGKTPAFGARAVLLVPEESQPTSSAVSDAAGRLTWTGLWIMRGDSSAAPDPPGQVRTPTVVVSLPGLAGASVIPIDPKNPKPFRAVLPPPLRASGRVTLGGEAITSQNARVWVIAEHQGRGVLDGPLGVEAIVEPDGRFTLRGLTPGTYRVQAARDGIWLSRAATLKVVPDEKPADLTLDIPEPGVAVTLALVDANDHPAAHERLTLTRPEGPFMDLWPEHFTTGADGTLTVRGLEAGTHHFLVEGENAPRTFEVPRESQAPVRRVFRLEANRR